MESNIEGVITCYSGKVVAKMLDGGNTDSYMYIDQKVRPDSCPICHNKLNLVPNLLIKVHSKDDLS